MSVRRLSVFIVFVGLMISGRWILHEQTLQAESALISKGKLAAADSKRAIDTGKTQKISGVQRLSHALPGYQILPPRLFPNKSAVSRLEVDGKAHVLMSSAIHPTRHIVTMPTNDLVDIGSFQVTQGVQTSKNSVALIQDRSGKYRPTVIRIAARSTTSLPLTVTITATLAFTVPGAVPHKQMVKFHSQPAVLTTKLPKLEDEDSVVMDVDLNSDWHMTSWVSLTAWIEVFSTDQSPQLLATSSSITYTISRTQTPQIFFYPIKFPNEIPPEMSTISSTIAASFVEGIFPTTAPKDFYRSVPYNTFICPIPDVGNDNIIYIEPQTQGETAEVVNPAEDCTIFHHLNSIRNGLVTCGVGPDRNTFVYGWVKGNPMPDYNGYGVERGNVAFGNTEAIRGQRTFAHELMHNFGLEHHDTEQLGTIGWDVNGRLLSPDDFWKTNQITTSLKSPWLFDITASGKETNQAWIATDTYTRLQSLLSVTDITPTAACLDDPEWITPTNQTQTEDICLQQQPDGSFRAYPFPSTLWPWALQSIPSQGRGLFTVQFVTRSGMVFSSQHDGHVGRDPAKAALDSVYGFLNASLPYTTPYSKSLDAITFMQIVDPNGRLVPIYDPNTQRYATTLPNRYTNVPFNLVITSPPPPSNVETTRTITATTFTVAWTVRPVQPRRLKNLEYQVLYSHNGGKIWQPLAVNLPGNIQRVTINREQLCTTTNGGILRVLASDGFNTTSAQIYISLSGAASDYCERGIIREADRPFTESGGFRQ